MIVFFSDPTIEVSTFCLCGWCMLGVFLLPFTRLGHECQDLLSLCYGMHMCTVLYIVEGIQPEHPDTPLESQ